MSSSSIFLCISFKNFLIFLLNFFSSDSLRPCLSNRKLFELNNLCLCSILPRIDSASMSSSFMRRILPLPVRICVFLLFLNFSS
ncbi:hypothetical protein ECANGB1_2660 [Enterospora canceri]|uniref:Uncharacterized protein n=1 Tax=Enterospora canceri TaxID=1081671 RepID=A0A1Y1S6B1_9MICR|nr:hypothetical protein ECANGB1_2660 [Enterospora canceri]